MRVKFKILAIAYVLLLLFGAAIVLSAFQHTRIRNELGALVDYPAPLIVEIGKFDVATSEYELTLRRLSARPSLPPAELEAAQKRIDDMAERIGGNLARALELLNAAVNDTRNNVGERLLLSRMAGATGNLKRDVTPFLELGRRTVAL